MKSEDITGGLDLLGDWLDAKGFTEEAGLCTRAMDEINRLREKIELLRESNDMLSIELREQNERYDECLENSIDISCEIADLRSENAKLKQAMMALQLLQRAEADVKLRAENARLNQAMHEIYEVYAGSEGFKPETCAEAYLQDRIKEMAYVAGKHKRAGETE